jgi:hypothetical protein
LNNHHQSVYDYDSVNKRMRELGFIKESAESPGQANGVPVTSTSSQPPKDHGWRGGYRSYYG